MAHGYWFKGVLSLKINENMSYSSVLHSHKLLMKKCPTGIH